MDWLTRRALLGTNGSHHYHDYIQWNHLKWCSEKCIHQVKDQNIWFRTLAYFNYLIIFIIFRSFHLRASYAECLYIYLLVFFIIVFVVICICNHSIIVRIVCKIKLIAFFNLIFFLREEKHFACNPWENGWHKFSDEPIVFCPLSVVNLFATFVPIKRVCEKHGIPFGFRTTQLCIDVDPFILAIRAPIYP